MKTHQPRKGNIVSLRVVFEPNRLERMSLQAAYERLVPIVRRAGRVKRAGPNGVGYDIEDFVCSVDGGELRAGDDASEARWVSHAELASLDLVPGLLDALASWDALPS